MFEIATNIRNLFTGNEVVSLSDKDEILEVRTRLSKNNYGYTDNNNEYIPLLNEVIHDRYVDRSRILGKGSYSIVIEAFDDILFKPVAIKIAKLEKFMEDSVKYEVDLITKINESKCQNIITIIDSFYWKNHFCIVMPILKTSLRKFNTQTVLSPFLIRHVIKNITMALIDLKKIKIVHGDLKPENIMVEPSLQTTLVDFGLAYQYDLKKDAFTYVQTRWYRAPEVILNVSIACHADIWSLGCILYELLTYQILFKGYKYQDPKFKNNSYHQLFTIESILGHIPDDLLNKYKSIENNLVSNYYNHNKEQDTYQLSHKFANSSSKTTLRDMLKKNSYLSMDDIIYFDNLLKLMLDYDFENRITPEKLYELL